MNRNAAILIAVLTILVIGLAIFRIIPLILIHENYVGPMEEKRTEMAKLYDAEMFLVKLERALLNVTETGGTTELNIDFPCELTIDPESNRIDFMITSEGAPYLKEKFICLSQSCSPKGVFGEDTYTFTGIQVTETEGNLSKILYSAIFRNLNSNYGIHSIEIMTPNNSILRGHMGSSISISRQSNTASTSHNIPLNLEIR